MTLIKKILTDVRERYQLFITYYRISRAVRKKPHTKRAYQAIRKWLQMSENCSKTKSRFLRSGWCVASHLAAIFLIFLPDLIGGVQLQIKSKHPHRHCVQSAGQVFQDCSSLYQVNDRPPSPLPPLPSSVVCDGSGFVLHHLYQGCH